MSVVTCQATEKDEAVSMKDWILRYAEQSSDEEEEEDEQDGGKKIRNPELDEKFDPVSENTVKLRYVDLFLYLYIQFLFCSLSITCTLPTFDSFHVTHI